MISKIEDDWCYKHNERKIYISNSSIFVFYQCLKCNQESIDILKTVSPPPKEDKCYACKEPCNSEFCPYTEKK